MSINLPHTFPSLIEGTSSPVLIVGAGASSKLAPDLEELFSNKCQPAEGKLGCCSGINFDGPSPDDTLYSWAEAIIAELELRGEPLPKLRMAEELGILNDSRWQPQVSCRALQNLPRHRVIAKFVRENRWKAIWSLNWDTYLETAFESIGIFPDPDPAPNDFPWTSQYRTFVTEEDYVVADGVFKLHKPHGCVRSLIQASNALKNGNPDGVAKMLSERFLITKKEMESLSERSTKQDKNFYANIMDAFSGHSLYILGWKAYVEIYLVEALEKVGNQLQSNSDDALCVINPTYYDKDEIGRHWKLASIYDRTKEQVFVKVVKDKSTDELLSTDDLFLWLQARYALGKLYQWAPESKKAEIQVIINSLNPPDPATQRLIYDWADCFLPAWMRLCWRAGLVNYYNAGQLIRPHDIRMESPDEHIPLFLDGVERIDIKSSIPLLLSLIDEGANLDLRKYPGGIYRTNDRTLIIPLPGWRTDYNDIEGLKPLIEEVKQNRGFGYVDRIAVLPLGCDSAPLVADAQYILPQMLSNKIDALPFAEVGGIVSITIDEISGGGHA